MLVHLTTRINGNYKHHTVRIPEENTPYCCEGMQNIYKTMDYDSVIQFYPREENLSMALSWEETEWNEPVRQYLPISFCPFCGDKFTFIVDKTVKMERKEVKRTVTDTITIETEIPNE